jgi:hypothetical protein
MVADLARKCRHSPFASYCSSRLLKLISPLPSSDFFHGRDMDSRSYITFVLLGQPEEDYVSVQPAQH